MYRCKYSSTNVKNFNSCINIFLLSSGAWSLIGWNITVLLSVFLLQFVSTRVQNADPCPILLALCQVPSLQGFRQQGPHCGVLPQHLLFHTLKVNLLSAQDPKLVLGHIVQQAVSSLVQELMISEVLPLKYPPVRWLAAQGLLVKLYQHSQGELLSCFNDMIYVLFCSCPVYWLKIKEWVYYKK